MVPDYPIGEDAENSHVPCHTSAPHHDRDHDRDHEPNLDLAYENGGFFSYAMLQVSGRRCKAAVRRVASPSGEGR